PGGGGGSVFDGSTDTSWDSAILAGVSIQREKWLFLFEGQYAGLSADRQNPLLTVKSDIYFFNVTGGWKFRDDLALTGGVKRMAIKIKANLGNGLEANTKPGVWDPMIGIDWRKFVTRKLELNGAVEGGGFGVGTDIDLSGGFVANYELFPHFILDMGYTF